MNTRGKGSVLMLFFLASFLGNSAMLAQSNAVPFVSAPLVPASARPGSKTFTLTVNGTGFAPTAVVNWNGAALPTSAISSSQLRAVVSASRVAHASTASVTVNNPSPGGGKSNVVFFPIRKPLPTVALVSSPNFNFPGPVIGVGDCNNDGKLDVLTDDGTNLGVDVFLGNGNGTFKPPVHSSASGHFTVGDFNGDGKLDLLAVLPVITFFRGNGDGTFTQQQSSGVVVADFAAAADLNGDGHLDFVSTGNAGGGFSLVHVCLGDGTGSFACSMVGAFHNTPPGDIALGDFNGDGKLDIAVAQGAVLDVFLNTGTGFTVIQYSTLFGGSAVVAADVNGDGKLDLITNGVAVLLGNGDGTFALSQTYDVGGSPVGIQSGDLNGDGHLDIAIGGASLQILFGNGDGTFQNPLIFPVALSPFPFFLGDFNNDGKLDLFGRLQTTALLTPSALSFPDQQVGTTSAPLTASLTNIDTVPLAINSIKTTKTVFAQTNNCGSSLAAGSTCTIQATFTPTAPGFTSASLNVSDKAAGSPQSVALLGTGVQASVSLLPSKLAFSAQLAGTVSSPQTVTLTNTGSAAVTISGVAVTGVFQQTNNCPSSLVIGTACQIQVVFAPTSGVKSAGTLSVTDSAPGSPHTVAFSGIGTVVKLSPIGVNFGSQKVGTTSAAVSITLTNTGAAALPVSQVAIVGTNPSDFSQTNTCGSSVPGHGTCTIKVKFKPLARGSRTGSVSITDADGASPQTVPVVGMGT